MNNPRKWKLWRVLKRRGMTMQDLADVTGYSRNHIQRVKSGDRPLSKGLRAAIVLALNVPADLLFSEEG